MLHCNMNTLTQRNALEDMLADMRHARRKGDLGRLAFVAYCEVRRWARDAGKTAIAEHASELIVASPFASKSLFLEQVDSLIHELEEVGPSLDELPVDAVKQTGSALSTNGARSP